MTDSYAVVSGEPCTRVAAVLTRVATKLPCVLGVHANAITFVPSKDRHRVGARAAPGRDDVRAGDLVEVVVRVQDHAVGGAHADRVVLAVEEPR